MIFSSRMGYHPILDARFAPFSRSSFRKKVTADFCSLVSAKKMEFFSSCTRKNSLPDLFCVLFASTIQLVIAGMARRIMTNSPSARLSTLFNLLSCAHDLRTVRQKICTQNWLVIYYFYVLVFKNWLFCTPCLQFRDEKLDSELVKNSDGFEFHFSGFVV